MYIYLNKCSFSEHKLLKKKSLKSSVYLFFYGHEMSTFHI